MACALLRGQRGIGMLGLQRSLVNRSCTLTGSAVCAASKTSTGRRTATAKTARTSSSDGLPDAYEPEQLKVPAFPPRTRPRSRAEAIVHNGASFAVFSTNNSTGNPVQAPSQPAPPAETHDAAQHADVLLDSSSAASTTAEVEPVPTVAPDSQLQHSIDEASDYFMLRPAPEEASIHAAAQAQAAAAEPAAAARAPSAPAHTAAHAATTSAADNNANSSSRISSTYQASVLVIDTFASSYQVARQLRLVNADAAHTGLQVSAYAAVERNSSSHAHSPNAVIVGVAHDRYTNINGSLKDAAVQGQLLRFVQRMLQQSADGSGPRIDSVVVFASPAADAACGVYSIPRLSSIGFNIDATGRLQQPEDVEQQAKVLQLQQQLYEADRHVSCVVELYRMIQALCAASDMAVQPPFGSTAGSTEHTQDAVQAVQVLPPTLTRLVMIGPWNEEQLLLPMTTQKLEAKRQRAATAAAAAARQRRGLRRASPGSSVISCTPAADAAGDNGQRDVTDMSVTASGAESDVPDTAAAATLQDDAGAMEAVPLGVHRRPFLEPQLAGSLTGGSLQVTKQPWCIYGELKGELPPLAVITDMQPGLLDGGCICSACDALVEEAEAHTAAADPAGAGDTGRDESALPQRPVQPIWPEALVLMLMRMLQGQVVAERAAAAQRAVDSAAAAAAAAAAAGGGPSGRGKKPGGGSNTAAAKKKKVHPVRPFVLEPPAPGTTEEGRREQLKLFFKPVLIEYAQTKRGLTIKIKLKKDAMISKIVENEMVAGLLGGS